MLVISSMGFLTKNTINHEDHEEHEGRPKQSIWIEH